MKRASRPPPAATAAVRSTGAAPTPTKHAPSPPPSASAAADEGGESSSSSTAETLRAAASFFDGAMRAAALPILSPLAARLLATATNDAASADGTGGTAADAASANATAAASSITASNAGAGVTAATAASAVPQSETDWSELSHCASYLLAAYCLGRSLGSYLALHFPSLRLTLLGEGRVVRRCLGVIVALYLFFLGAGSTQRSFVWVMMVRLATAVAVGILCGATASAAAGDGKSDTSNHMNENDPESGDPTTALPSSRNDDAKVVSSDDKLWLRGFALSSLLTGWLYDSYLEGSSTFAALTGTYPRTLSPLFFVAVVMAVERLLSRLGVGPPDRRRSESNQPVSRRVRFAVGALARNVGRVVSSPVRRRRAAGGGSGTNAYRPVPMQGDVTHEDELVEFHDPLSESKHGRLHLSTPARGSVSQLQSRGRADSDGSAAFFDCEEPDVVDEGVTSSTPPRQGASHDRSHAITEYANERCVFPSDGSPSSVPPGQRPHMIPAQYVEICGGNRIKAQTMWEKTRHWRIHDNVWKIHSLPNPWFSKIKRAYPHFVHGYSRAGYPIVYEQPGKMNFKSLFRDGCTVEDMLHSYVYFMEYVQNVICRRPELQSRRRGRSEPESWGLLLVMDISGASLSSLSGDVLKYMKRAGDIQSAHYPLSMRRAFVVKSPFWLAGAWSGIRSILPESVHVDLLSAKEYGTKLREFIDDDQIPPEYGGSSPYALGEHPFERDLAETVERGMAYASSSSNPDAGLGSSAPGLVPDRDFDDVLNAVADEHELSSPLLSSGARRRTGGALGASTHAQDGPQQVVDDYEERTTTSRFHDPAAAPAAEDAAEDASRRALLLVSALRLLHCLAAGVLELSLPLWLACPPALGGVGYNPVRIGAALCVAAVVPLRLCARFPRSAGRVTSGLTKVEPLRGLRIGSGCMAGVLAVLPVMPATQPAASRMYSVALMVVTTILIACLIVASSLGRSASASLHDLAVSNHRHRKSHPGRRRHTESLFTGGALLDAAGELAGILAAGWLFGWSVRTPSDFSFPFDAACCFYAAALLHLSLYAACFSLHIESSSEGEEEESSQRTVVPSPKRALRDAVRRGDGCAATREVLKIFAGDCHALFEEGG